MKKQRPHSASSYQRPTRPSRHSTAKLHPRTTSAAASRRRPARKNHPAILGKGKDGCVISNVFAGEPHKVVKLYYQDHFPTEVMMRLKEIDGEHRYFNIETPLSLNIKHLIPESVLRQCAAPPVRATTMSYLIPIADPKKMTKIQYRHLRSGIELLHQNGISHGDLVENVMLDPRDGMPRIIDWTTASLNASPVERNIDYIAFMNFFKAARG